MSCVNCEEVEKANDVTYIRVGKANVGVIGCDEHVGKVFDILNWASQEGIEVEPSGRQIVRLKRTDHENP